MNNDQLKQLLLVRFQEAPKPLSKEDAMVIVDDCLQAYPKQRQSFGDWFEKYSDQVLEYINHV